MTPSIFAKFWQVTFSIAEMMDTIIPEKLPQSKRTLKILKAVKGREKGLLLKLY